VERDVSVVDVSVFPRVVTAAVIQQLARIAVLVRGIARVPVAQGV